MLLQETIERLTEWTEKNICSEIELLDPDENNMARDYEYKRVHPIAIPLFIPSKDLMPPQVQSKLPAVCLQFDGGQDDLKEGVQSLKFRMSFCVYRPGLYLEEENPDGTKEVRCTRNADGWKDAWLFMEIAKHRLENNMYIEGIRIDKNVPMKYDNFKLDDAIVLNYPEWYTWLSFSVNCGISKPARKNYNQFL